MKYMYQAIIENKDNKYYACIKELPGCVTTGNTFEDAIKQITDAASMYLIVAEDEKLDISKSNIADSESGMVITIDTDEYRKNSL